MITWSDLKDSLPRLTKEQLELPVLIISGDGEAYFTGESLNLSSKDSELGPGHPMIAINFASWEPYDEEIQMEDDEEITEDEYKDDLSWFTKGVRPDVMYME